MNIKTKLKPMSASDKRHRFKALALSVGMVALVAGTGCATSLLMYDNGSTTTKTVTHTQVLMKDEIVAFGRPAHALPNMPSSSMAIVGEKNSYVLSQGGAEMVSLLTNLSAEHIRVDNDMNFYSPNNDGYFQGNMALSYAKPKREFQRVDYEFFIRNKGVECTTESDKRSTMQRFCFNVPIKGAVYPPVNNLDMLRSQYQTLSRPYAVSVYTTTTSEETTTDVLGTLGTLAVLPFAVAFDVVTSPLLMLLLIAN